MKIKNIIQSELLESARQIEEEKKASEMVVDDEAEKAEGKAETAEPIVIDTTIK